MNIRLMLPVFCISLIATFAMAGIPNQQPVITPDRHIIIDPDDDLLYLSLMVTCELFQGFHDSEQHDKSSTDYYSQITMTKSGEIIKQITPNSKTNNFPIEWVHEETFKTLQGNGSPIALKVLIELVKKERMPKEYLEKFVLKK
jgi:hypothetical protein